VDKILIRVGSLSEHKIGAVRDACEQLGIDAEVVGVKAASGVPEQPVKMEAAEGAIARARAMRRMAMDTLIVENENVYQWQKRVEDFEKIPALYVGIENGIAPDPRNRKRYFDAACVVLTTNDHVLYETWSTALEVNGEDVVRAQFRGFDKHTVASVTAERTGCDPNDATPYYTGGRVTRRELLAQAVKVVLAQWMADEERRVRAS